MPNRETITRWCKRLGLDRVTQNQTSPRLKNQDDMIWIVDHSNQIGTQKVLVILGIPASELPAIGETLSLDQLEVLMVRPGESWTRDDVRAVYREQIASWKRCCDVIGRSLWWINTHALQRDTEQQLCGWLEPQRVDRCELSDQMLALLLEFLASSSSGLGAGERAWLSSAALESVFGLFKRRENQQSRSGFTGLIVSLPTLLRSWSAAEVRAGLRRTDMKTVNQWVEYTVGSTLWSKRAQAFAHFGKKCPKFQPL